jgi:hypothetical protein
MYQVQCKLDGSTIFSYLTTPSKKSAVELGKKLMDIGRIDAFTIEKWYVRSDD